MKNKRTKMLLLLSFIALITIVFAGLERKDSMETVEEIIQGVFNGTLIGADNADWYMITGLSTGQGILQWLIIGVVMLSIILTVAYYYWLRARARKQ